MVQPAAGTWQEGAVRAAAERVIRVALDASTSWLWAPPGFGKASIRELLVTHHGATLIAPEVGARWTVEVAEGGADPVRISGARRPPLDARRVSIGRDTLAVGRDDLPADAPPHAVDAWERSGGWPAHLCALATSSGLDAPLPPVTLQALDDLVERCTAELDQATLRVAEALSQLDRFTPEMIVALGPEGGVDELLELGLPIVEEEGGWLTLLEPVRSSLRAAAGGVLSSDAARRLEQPMALTQGAVATAEVLMASGRADVAASLLVGTPTVDLERCPAPRLLSLLELLRHQRPDDGRLALLAAGANGDLARFGSQRAHLEDALRLARCGEETSLAIEAQAEVLLLDMENGSVDDAESRLGGLRSDATSESNQLTRTRLDEIEALVLAQTGVLSKVHDAAERLELVAHRWELLGERNRAARTIRRLSAGCLLHLGEYARAANLLKRAAAIAGNNPEELLRTNRLQMFLAARSGDADDYERLIEVDAGLVRRVEPVRWLEAFRAWAAMFRAAFAGDHDRALERRSEAEARLGELLDTGTGAVFLADAAICAALVDDEALARRLQARLHDRSDLKAVESLVCDAVVEGRFGSPGELLDVLERRHGVEVPAARMWTLEAARLDNARRHGQDVDAEVAEVLADAERFGLGALARRTLELTGACVDCATVRVEVLGALRVTSGGEELSVPAGKVTELLKLLAVRERRLPVDVVIDHLWPDADLDRGRTRLRNCINRLRNSLGPDTVVRTAETLELGPSVAIDLREFWAAVESAGARPSSAATAARLYRGNLLETDLYDDWLFADRQAVASAMETALRQGLAAATIDEALAETIRHRLERTI